MPIHDQEELKDLRKNWVISFFKNQPLGILFKIEKKKLNSYNKRQNM